MSCKYCGREGPGIYGICDGCSIRFHQHKELMQALENNSQQETENLGIFIWDDSKLNNLLGLTKEQFAGLNTREGIKSFIGQLIDVIGEQGREIATLKKENFELKNKN